MSVCACAVEADDKQPRPQETVYYLCTILSLSLLRPETSQVQTCEVLQHMLTAGIGSVLKAFLDENTKSFPGPFHNFFSVLFTM